ncbi:ankyrin-1-like isoform X2 [Lytechinus pictus]|uniref:ankyrin-1-like isoform X2 n=1 Tax=Lytechinus pictus TaxID=7653 RepID=UPI0030BA0B56
MLGVLNTMHSGSNAHATNGDNFLCNLPTSQRPNGDVDNMSQGSGSAPMSPPIITGNIIFYGDSIIEKRRSLALELKDLKKEVESLYSVSSERSSNRDIDQTDEKGCTSLYKAAKRGQFLKVINLVGSGEDPNKANEDGRRALHVAAEEGHQDIVKFLVVQGADVNAECDLSQTALHAVMHNDQCISAAATGMGHLNIVKYLIEEGSKIDKRDHRGYTPLHIAAAKGYLEIVKYLTGQKCSVKEVDNAGLTPLSLAAKHGHLDTVKYLADGRVDEKAACSVASRSGHRDIAEFFVYRILLRSASSHGDLDTLRHLLHKGFDINSCFGKGWTPLEYAIQNDKCEVIDYLLTNGANQCNEESPLYMASRLGHLDAVKVLISRGISVNVESHGGQIPLHAASATGRIQVVKILIENGSDLNKTDIDGSTPLHAAVQNGHLEVVEYLMRKGAIDIKNRGMTSLYTAAQSGHLDIVDLFLSNGSDLNEEDDTGCIPLHAAAASGSLKIVEMLINHGSNVNKMADNGWTPLHAAVYSGRLDVVQYLISHGATKTSLKGMTLLYIAEHRGHINLIKYFATTGCDVNDGTDSGKTPFLAPSYSGEMDSVEMLVNHGAYINQSDRNKWTHVHAAAQEGNLRVVTYLIKNGADTNAKDTYGMTALQAAEDGDHEDVKQYIIRLRAKMQEERHNDTQKANGMTPLQATEDTGHQDVQQRLIQFRGGMQDEQHKNTDKTDGMTPLQVAEDTGHQDVQQRLIQFRGGMQDEQHKNTDKTDGMTPLQVAEDTGHQDVQQCFIRLRADVQDKRYNDTEKTDGMTPLHVAEDTGHQDVQQHFIRFRGRVQDERHKDTKKTDGMTPLQAAEDPGHADVQQCLNQLGSEMHNERHNDTDKSFRSEGNSPEEFTCSWMPEVSASNRLPGINSESSYSKSSNVLKASISTENPLRTLREIPYPDILKTTIRSTRVSCVSRQKTQHGCGVPATDDFPVTSMTNENEAGDLKPGIKSKRRNTDNCFSTLTVLHRAILALVFYFAFFPILVAGNLRLTDPVTLEVGTRGVVTFHLQRPSNTLQFSLYYKIQFESKRRPFCIDGQYDPDGFKDPSQESRFTTTIINRNTSPSVKMRIDDVDYRDEGRYILEAVWHSGENILYDTQKKKVIVQRSPGPADCFITSSDSEHPKEVHCRAKTGSMPTTFTCYQNDRDLEVHSITHNGHTTRGIFFLPDTTHFSCCSHGIKSTVGAAKCSHFQWSPGHSGIPSTDPIPKTKRKSNVGSGACRSSMIPSHWHFIYLFLYLFALFIMC